MNMQTTTDTQGNIVLDTTTPWTYTFACATMCGHGHREMQGTVIIE
jgi:heme/copper-type cytochrome/quinol oxidase subunit 2